MHGIVMYMNFFPLFDLEGHRVVRQRWNSSVSHLWVTNNYRNILYNGFGLPRVANSHRVLDSKGMDLVKKHSMVQFCFPCALRRKISLHCTSSSKLAIQL